MGVRLSDVYCDARQAIEDILGDVGKLSIRMYGSLYSNLCDVLHYYIENEDDLEGYANMLLELKYKERGITPDNKFKFIERYKLLKVLNNKADNIWTFNMINKIWEGDYPSSVAVNMENGEVYLLNIRISGLEIVKFGELGEKEFETFKNDLNEREPFKIKIDELAMFKYIDGAEGYNHIKENIFVEFNCLVKLRVYAQKIAIV